MLLIQTLHLTNGSISDSKNGPSHMGSGTVKGYTDTDLVIRSQQEFDPRTKGHGTSSIILVDDYASLKRLSFSFIVRGDRIEKRCCSGFIIIVHYHDIACTLPWMNTATRENNFDFDFHKSASLTHKTMSNTDLTASDIKRAFETFVEFIPHLISRILLTSASLDMLQDTDNDGKIGTEDWKRSLNLLSTYSILILYVRTHHRSVLFVKWHLITMNPNRATMQLPTGGDGICRICENCS